MNDVKLGLAGCLLMLATASHVGHAQTQAPIQADAVTIKRATELRDAPGENARSLAPLPVQTQVTRLTARQGPWIEVRTAQGTTGWIHMFDAGTAPAAQGGNAATGALRGLTSFFGKGTGQAQATGTSTIGIRGLGAEDIANAQPNLVTLTQVEGMRLNVNQARQFGSSAALTPQVVAELPVPAPPNQNAARTNGPGGSQAPATTNNAGGGER